MTRNALSSDLSSCAGRLGTPPHPRQEKTMQGAVSRRTLPLKNLLDHIPVSLPTFWRPRAPPLLHSSQFMPGTKTAGTMSGTLVGEGAGCRLLQDPPSSRQPRSREEGRRVFFAQGLGGLRRESGVSRKIPGFTQLLRKR